MSKRTYAKHELQQAVELSYNYRQVLTRLGLSSNGSGGYKSLQRAMAEWDIDISHFDPYRSSQPGFSKKQPLENILTVASSYPSTHLKRRLYKEDLKQPICEKCGQGEVWQGKPMSLILDHINGVNNDHRLENLQIVCPNCNATLDTHCGKQLAKIRLCVYCQEAKSWRGNSKYCKAECRQGAFREKNQKRLQAIKEQKLPNHKSMRPSYEELISLVEAEGYSATGRKYGVSDNAIRKWVRAYQQELGTEEAVKFAKAEWYREHGQTNKEDLQVLIGQGYSLKQIARHYHVHRNTAKKWCLLYGLKTQGMKNYAVT